MLKKILVPLDGSSLSESVFPWLRYLLAHISEKPDVLLVRTYEPPSMVYLLPELAVPTSHAFNEEALGEAVLAYLVEKADELAELKVDYQLLVGDAAAEILAKAEEADLVLMASHGRGGLGRWLLGSVANKVARGATIPVMIVGAKAQESEFSEITLKNILVPVDGSEVAERAFRKACGLAAIFGSKVLLYQGVSQVELKDQVALEANRAGMVFATSYLKGLAASVDGLQVEWKVKECFGHTGIVTQALEVDADLIVMGSHGRGGFVRWMLGSESERVLHAADCPVMLVH